MAARKRPRLTPPKGRLYATVTWDTWFPECREVLVFENKRAAESDARRLDPGWRAVLYPIEFGAPILTADGDPVSPYDDGDNE